jgi:hypothetical protein
MCHSLVKILREAVNHHERFAATLGLQNRTGGVGTQDASGRLVSKKFWVGHQQVRRRVPIPTNDGPSAGEYAEGSRLAH